jgi:hypothetical protein
MGANLEGPLLAGSAKTRVARIPSRFLEASAAKLRPVRARRKYPVPGEPVGRERIASAPFRCRQALGSRRTAFRALFVE